MRQPREQGACHVSSAERWVLDRAFTSILPCAPVGQGGAGCLSDWGSEAARPRVTGPMAGRRERTQSPCSGHAFLRDCAHPSPGGAHVPLSGFGCVCLLFPSKENRIRSPYQFSKIPDVPSKFWRVPRHPLFSGARGQLLGRRMWTSGAASMCVRNRERRAVEAARLCSDAVCLWRFFYGLFTGTSRNSHCCMSSIRQGFKVILA